MTTAILCGDVFDVLPTLEAGSVDVCVTSPPYWQLRSYLPKDHPLKLRELGSEPTPAEYVARMVEVFRLVRRAMAPHATCWVNIGDSYSANRNDSEWLGGKGIGSTIKGPCVTKAVPEGNLCLIPQRLAIALQEDGWLCRSVIVWHKPAPMPGSMAGWRWARCRVKVKELRPRVGTNFDRGSGRKDGYTGGHVSENTWNQYAPCPGCPKCLPNGGLVLRRGKWRPTSSWEPVLMLAKGPGYYADGIPVQTAPAAATVQRDKYTRVLDDPDEQFAVRHDHETVCEGGANLRDVWTIASESLREKHYAAFPSELVYRCLAAGTSARGYCPACSAPWARVVETQATHDNRPRPAERVRPEHGWGGLNLTGSHTQTGTATTTLGWRPTCSHGDLPPRPGMVLDCFAGSGRCGVQAQRLGLDFVGVELSPEYARMAERLLYEASPLFGGGGEP